MPRFPSLVSAGLSTLLAYGAAAPAHAQEPFAPPVAAARPRPTTAASALDQASAAYEFGDLPLVVESARLVAEGELEGTDEQKAEAFRYLGIGLYLTGRTGGAEAAFVELLKLRPNTQLDRRTTRPEVVAFFEDVRRRRNEALWKDAMERKWIGWAFVPPVGQFQNGQRGKGWTLLAVEGAAGLTALTTWGILTFWHQPDDALGEKGEHNPTGRTLKTINHVSLGVLGAAAVYGVIDALANFGRPPTEAQAKERAARAPRLHIGPGSVGLALRF